MSLTFLRKHRAITEPQKAKKQVTFLEKVSQLLYVIAHYEDAFDVDNSYKKKTAELQEKIKNQKAEYHALSDKYVETKQRVEAYKLIEDEMQYRIDCIRRLHSRLSQIDSVEICLSKIRYESYNYAKLVAWTIYQKNNGEMGLEPYCCPACQQFHLTKTVKVPKLPSNLELSGKANVGIDPDNLKSLLDSVLGEPQA